MEAVIPVDLTTVPFCQCKSERPRTKILNMLLHATRVSLQCGYLSTSLMFGKLYP